MYLSGSDESRYVGKLSTDDEKYQLHQSDLVKPNARKSSTYGDLNRFIRLLIAPATPYTRFSLIRAWLDEEAHFGYTFLWFSVALIAGAYFNFTRQNDIPIFALFFPFFSLLVIQNFVKGLSVRSKYVAGLGIACLIGAMAVNFEQRNDFVLLDQAVTTSIAGVVVGKEIGANNMPRYKIKLIDTSDPKIVRSPAIVQLVARSSHHVFDVGDQISGRARLSPPSGPVLPGGYDFSMANLRGLLCRRSRRLIQGQNFSYQSTA